MDLDALLKTLMAMVGDNPAMVLLLTISFFFLKMIFPAPAPASSQVLSGYAERIRLALLAGNMDGARELANAGISKAAQLLKEETEPQPKGILDIFTGLFTNGNLMPLLMIGGVFLLLMLTQGGGCSKKASANPVLTPTTVSESPEWFTAPGSATPDPRSMTLASKVPHVQNAVYRVADAADVAPSLPFGWAEPLASRPAASVYGQGIDGPDRGGNGPANAGTCGTPIVGGLACTSCGPRASLATGRSQCYGVGWHAGPRARPVARVARAAYRPAARVAVGIVGFLRWARPVRRAGAILGFRHR